MARDCKRNIQYGEAYIYFKAQIWQMQHALGKMDYVCKPLSVILYIKILELFCDTVWYFNIHDNSCVICSNKKK